MFNNRFSILSQDKGPLAAQKQCKLRIENWLMAIDDSANARRHAGYQ
jgi:hypothetical protein